MFGETKCEMKVGDFGFVCFLSFCLFLYALTTLLWCFLQLMSHRYPSYTGNSGTAIPSPTGAKP